MITWRKLHACILLFGYTTITPMDVFDLVTLLLVSMLQFCMVALAFLLLPNVTFFDTV